MAGHAVRQLYLDCGAVDVATELGDQQLLDAVMRRWRDMVATRMYLTGGLGSRHADESFGDPFELPPDGAYAETCASIASASRTRSICWIPSGHNPTSVTPFSRIDDSPSVSP